MKSILSVLVVLFLVGCSLVEDPATSIAFDIERGIRHLGSENGASYVIVHDAKSRAGADARMIKVQFDKVGALIVVYGRRRENFEKWKHQLPVSIRRYSGDDYLR